MEDRQQLLPAGWCVWCGRELYPGEEAWWLDGSAVHRDCLGEYALEHCPHGYLIHTDKVQKRERRK